MGSRGVAIEPRAAGHRKTAETADREAPHRLPRATGRADQTAARCELHKRSQRLNNLVVAPH
jgi:hypothetical protein